MKEPPKWLFPLWPGSSVGFPVPNHNIEKSDLDTWISGWVTPAIWHLRSTQVKGAFPPFANTSHWPLPRLLPSSCQSLHSYLYNRFLILPFPCQSHLINIPLNEEISPHSLALKTCCWALLPHQDSGAHHTSVHG